MNVKRKKYIKFGIALISILIMINVIEGIIGINQENMNKGIDNYFKKQEIEVEAGKVKKFSHEQLGNDKFGMLINQYSLVKLDLYYLNEDGTINEKCNTAIYPVRFKIISFLGFYKVISCSLPSDGKEDSENYKKIFPKKIINILNKKLR